MDKIQSALLKRSVLWALGVLSTRDGSRVKSIFTDGDIRHFTKNKK